jgi:hypothetical protein
MGTASKQLNQIPGTPLLRRSLGYCAVCFAIEPALVVGFNQAYSAVCCLRSEQLNDLCCQRQRLTSQFSKRVIARNRPLGSGP